MQLRVRALETILTEKGYVDPAALDLIVESVETKIGPHNGARIVARAWADPDVQARGSSRTPPRRPIRWALSSPVGSASDRGREHAADAINMVVCTLCSCYPWEVLGLPPVWYKSAPYRSRAVIDPKGVLADFGVKLPPETEIRVWDSTAETRFLVVPMRPGRHRGLERGASSPALVTRDSMVGTGLAKSPAGGRRR